MKQHEEVVVTPIYYWEDCDIWEYIRLEKIKTNPLYDKGYDRVGCVGCPLATHKKILKEFEDFPKYKQAYIKAFEKMLSERKKLGKNDSTGKWKDAESVFNWWIEEDKHNVKGQLSLFDDKPQA